MRSANSTGQAESAAALARAARDRAQAREVAIVGRVLDQAGRSLARASVCASTRAQRAAQLLSVHCVDADPNGNYQIPLLAAGAYRLVAAAEGHRPSGAREHPELVVMPAADLPLRRDFLLSQGGARVAGIVVDREGGTVEAARVEALGTDGPVAAVVSALTDEHGNFVLSTDEGPITLRARADGYAESTYVTSAPSSAVQIELGAASRLAGEVVSETDEEPLGGIVVTAIERAALSFASTASATTDEAGRFSIEGLSAGSYELEAQGGRSHGRLSQPVVVGVGETRDGLRLWLDAGVTVAGRVLVGAARRPCPGAQLSLTGPTFRAASVADSAGAFRFESVPAGVRSLHASCATAARQAPFGRELAVGATDLTELELLLVDAVSLRGRVIDDRGHGVSAQPVVVDALSADALGAAAVSASDGTFEVTGLAPGSYRVALQQWPEASRSVTLTDRGGAQQVVLEQPASGTIRVQLRAASGALDDDWVVHAWSGPTQRLALRRGSGLYEVSGLADGRYEVSAYDPNGTSVSTVSEIRGHQRAEVTLQVPERRAQITGVVSDERGAPVGDARIVVVASGGAPAGPNGARFVLSDRDGSFSLDRLSQEATYDLLAESPLDGSARLDTVPVGKHVTLRLSGPSGAPPRLPAGVLTAGSAPPSGPLTPHAAAEARSTSVER